MEYYLETRFPVRNYYICNDYNKDIEFMSEVEVSEIIDLVGHKLKKIRRVATGNTLVRLALSGVDYKLMGADDVDIYISYNDFYNYYLLRICVYNDCCEVKHLSDEIRTNSFVWAKFYKDNGNTYSALIPDVYAEYLISNKDARDRELSKILNRTCFIIKAETGTTIEVTGIDMARSLYNAV